MVSNQLCAWLPAYDSLGSYALQVRDMEEGIFKKYVYLAQKLVLFR